MANLLAVSTEITTFALLNGNPSLYININMRRKLLFLFVTLFCGCFYAYAQQTELSDLHQRALAEDAKGNLVNARYMFIRAFEDYSDKGQTELGVKCAVRATALYYNDNLYREAFDLLRRVDQSVNSEQQASTKNVLRYLVTKERMRIYMKLRKSANVLEQLNVMESQANAAGVDSLKNDLLFNKAIYYYTFGQTEKGNEVFQKMAVKLTADKDYDRVSDVFQTLIASGIRSGNANLVDQAYSKYIAWKDSVAEKTHTAITDSLQKRIDSDAAIITDKDDSLSTRSMIITGLIVLAAILAGVLVLVAIVLIRYMVQTRKQKNTIKQLKENDVLKAKFIKNISSQLAPSLQKLDGSLPEVKALRGFTDHIQTLAELDSMTGSPSAKEEIQVQPFCEQLMDEIRGKVKSNVELIVKVPKLSTTVNKEYVTHILRHLLNNAAIYTPEGGHITLDFKKRSARTQQFLVWDTGCGIPEEKREDVFKPFLEIRDLSKGDGLGLPICRSMAQKMDGDLTIDPTFTKGTRFVLDLHI